MITKDAYRALHASIAWLWLAYSTKAQHLSGMILIDWISPYA